MIAHTEDRLHQHIWNALQFILPAGAVPQSFENRQNGAREGARRKARGCLPGWPDLGIVWNERTYYIELKAPKGRLSPEQKVKHAELRAAGAKVGVCRSLDEVIDFLRSVGMPVRAEVMA
ncbi:hypothetical protein AD945_06180 [Gluconobacter albidus]|uniref:VRR-NUC domain-containing protein n=1 Tax=Gluconobacter albidus TaxID=318683 RepID=A0A149TK30_9PROT|nr:VRR-NUC domain-containing protein [Gluconobacter albidus]KXV48735.1 hypothetical protein AD945_06180 [Gluconobacter albidus]